MDSDPEIERRVAEAEAELEAEMEARRNSVAEEVRSADDPSGVDASAFAVDASNADVDHAQDMLASTGMIPASDLAGHRGAVELWRTHCDRRRGTDQATLRAELDKVLAAPRPQHPATGKQDRPVYAWVRPSDIPVTSHEAFPYHCTPDELAELGLNLVREAGDPAGMDEILGEGLSLTTSLTPRGPVHRVNVNGNHRAAAIRAAGFPVALAEITLEHGPWAVSDNDTSSQALTRLLYRCGLLTDYRPNDPSRLGRDTVEAEGIASWLLGFQSATAARNNLLAYEAMFGRDSDSRLLWIRDLRSFKRLLRHERMELPEFGLDVLPRVQGQWPPRPTLGQRLEYWLSVGLSGGVCR
ncbi:hypothetical protein ACFV9C_42890 [Kribbella sp. NPDC059898]|uniref:hypothetical protein n=1 Tax=Kribbella sp. NPDC059898 TaxID=3346995 RepID=UPI00364D8ECC